MDIVLQPTYFPDIYSAAALVQAHSVLLETCDNYQKQSYRSRMYVGTANGKLLLNIPIKHTDSGNHKKTRDSLIENNFLWQRQHWRSMFIAYRTSPFFEFYEDDLYPLFHKKWESLLDLNKASIEIILEMLDIDKPLEDTTEYKEEYTDVFDFRFLADAKRKSKVEIPPYRQVFKEQAGFIPKLSVLDLIFNLGPEATEYLSTLNLNTL